jgi:hypothetical protein
VKKVQPIADMLAAGEELFPEETPGGRIPVVGKLIWIILPLVIFAMVIGRITASSGLVPFG